MKKRYNLIFILVLAFVLVFSLVACNQQSTDPGDLPEEVGGIKTDDLPESSYASLKFSFPREMSSIFNSIYVDEFELSEYVHYSVVYRNRDGAVVKEIPYGGVSEQMVKEEDRQYLSVAGHHNIHVTEVLDDNTTASGVFELHLKDRSGAISLAQYVFKLKDTNGTENAHPYFGVMNSSRTEVHVDIEKGVTFNSWQEFTRAFQLSIHGKALESVSTDNGATYSELEGFPFTVNGDEMFSLRFTDDVVTVTYDLNLPSDAVLRSEFKDSNPADLFKEGGEYFNRSVVRGTGTVPQPSDDEINLYHGYMFAGWFNTADDTLWRFGNKVGNLDLNLQARWVLAEYSFTVYTMGGVFKDDVVSSTDKNGVTITEANAESLGYTVIESTSRFALSTGELNRITFTGFHFDVDYNQYVAKVTLNKDGDTAMLKFGEIYDQNSANSLFTKGGDSLKIEELYYNYQCIDRVNRTLNKVDDTQPVTYMKWVFNATGDGESDLEKMSYYYTQVVFKDGYTILADGSVRLDQVKDWTVNELIVPAEIRVGGEVRKISEIGERALANAKAITTLNLSGAVNLTTIGKEAFAHATYLAEIRMPENDAIQNIGDNAFWDTAFEDKYAELNQGAEFIVISNMIYKYVGEDIAKIDLSVESYYSAETHPNMSAEKMEEFNSKLMGVTSIEDGAFARCPSLQTLLLPSNITIIRNNAFSGLASFRTLKISEVKEPEAEEGGSLHSALLNIGESAFVGTPFLSEEGNCYVQEIGAIIIGNVYYRFLDKNAKVAQIPEKNLRYEITHIAPQAFVGCEALEEVKFGNESLIKSIGKNAFTDTKILRDNKKNDNPYTVYNGILTDYFGNTMNANEVNLIVPNTVNTIAMNAFGKYGKYFETIQIGTQVTNIENYAFSGANMLAKVILTGVGVNYDESDETVTVKDEEKALVNAPSIGEYAFADSNGEMRSSMIMYFDNRVIKLLSELDSKDVTPSDKVTAEWLNLYRMHKNHFEAEAISSVVIDAEKVANVLMQTSEGAPKDGEPYTLPFVDTYGANAIIEGALIITSNTDVERREDLSLTANKIELVLIKKPQSSSQPEALSTEDQDVDSKYDYSILWKDEWEEDGAVTRYVLFYTYDPAPDKCMVNPNDPSQRNQIFIVSVYNAVVKEIVEVEPEEKDPEEEIGGEDPNGEDLGDENLGGEEPGGGEELGGEPEVEKVFKKIPLAFTELSASYVGTIYEVNGTVINANNYIKKVNSDEDKRTLWFVGLDGQDVAGATVPTYYTSYPRLKYGDYSGVVFHYIDLSGEERTLVPSSISNLDTSVDGRFVAEIVIDFYGIGTFKFAYTYEVKVSRYAEIEQTKAINIPVNARASDYLGSTPLNLIGEDKNKKAVDITSDIFSSIQLFNTSTLGQHTATVRYTSSDAVRTLSFNVVYTVVLEADESIFTYEKLNDKLKYARITGLKPTVSKNNITTLVLPSIWKDGNDTYTVTQIGDMQDNATGIFEKCTNLSAVYLPETLQVIGANTFKGCTNLKYINTAIQAEATRMEIATTDENFEKVGTSYKEKRPVEGKDEPEEWTIQPVKLTAKALESLTIGDSKELIIAGNYVISEENKEMYRLIAIEDGAKINGTGIDVYLPNTIYYSVNIVDGEDKPISPFYYASGTSMMIKTESNVPKSLVTIGGGAFNECVDLENIDLSKAVDLADIGVLAFANSGLKEIDLSNNVKVTVINSQVFENCLALETVKLHGNITTIGARAFNKCKYLKTVSGSLSKLTYLGANAFGQAQSLTRIELYESLTGANSYVGNSAFGACSALTIYCRFGEDKTAKWDEFWNSNFCPVVWNYPTNEYVVKVVGTDGNTGNDITENVIYYVDEQSGLRYELKDDKGTKIATLATQAYAISGEVVVPSTVAYKGNTYTVVTIGESAFKDNDNITSVTVTSSVKNIGSNAFTNCTGLLLFTYSDANGLENIAPSAFTNTGLVEVPQPAGSIVG